MSDINTIIRKCCAVIRQEIKREKEFYDRLVPILDKAVAQDLSVKEGDIQQAQWDRRQDLWKYMFEEYNKKLKTLLEVLNKHQEKKDESNS